MDACCVPERRRGRKEWVRDVRIMSNYPARSCPIHINDKKRLHSTDASGAFPGVPEGRKLEHQAALESVLTSGANICSTSLSRSARRSASCSGVKLRDSISRDTFPS